MNTCSYNISIHQRKIDWPKGAVPVNDKDVIAVSWNKKDGGYIFEYVIPSKRNAVYHVPESFKKYSIAVDGKNEPSLQNSSTLNPGRHIIAFK